MKEGVHVIRVLHSIWKLSLNPHSLLQCQGSQELSGGEEEKKWWGFFMTTHRCNRYSFPAPLSICVLLVTQYCCCHHYWTKAHLSSGGLSRHPVAGSCLLEICSMILKISPNLSPCLSCCSHLSGDGSVSLTVLVIIVWRFSTSFLGPRFILCP